MNALFFFGSFTFFRKSNKFNALLYGHLYALKNTELFSDELKDLVKNCDLLTKFSDEIEKRYYSGSG